jgi:hypothetical protein
VLSRQHGWQRTPGVIIGGTPAPAPSDFTPLNDVGVNLIMKLGGFPPFVVYLSYVGTPEGVITATRPDGGYWAQRVREGDTDGWLRIGDTRYAMQGDRGRRSDPHARAVLGTDRPSHGRAGRRARSGARLGGLLLDATVDWEG